MDFQRFERLERALIDVEQQSRGILPESQVMLPHERRIFQLLPIVSADPTRVIRILNLRGEERTPEGDTAADVFSIIWAVRRWIPQRGQPETPSFLALVEAGLITAL